MFTLTVSRTSIITNTDFSTSIEPDYLTYQDSIIESVAAQFNAIVCEYVESGYGDTLDYMYNLSMWVKDILPSDKITGNFVEDFITSIKFILTLRLEDETYHSDIVALIKLVTGLTFVSASAYTKKLVNLILNLG